MESPRWSVTELVARVSDRWDRAALDLALALVVVFASSAGRSLGSLWLAFADRPPRRGDSNSKPSVSCSTSPDSEHQPGERRKPERSEAEPNY